MGQKLWYIYTMEYYAAERKKELLPFVTTGMEVENIMQQKETRSSYPLGQHGWLQKIFNIYKHKLHGGEWRIMPVTK